MNSLRKMLTLIITVCLVISVSRTTLAVEPATVIAGAALATQLLDGIAKAVTNNARVDAQSISDGPDDNDFGFLPDQDELHWGEETFGYLDADTHRKNGTIELGPNPSNPHEGWARLWIEKDGAWKVVPGKRSVFAWAKEDTTPTEGDNTTAAASVATFAYNGKIKKTFKKTDVAGVGLAPPAPIGAQEVDNEDITVSAGAAMIWSPSAFSIVDHADGSVTVAAPVQRRSLFNSFVQMESSPSLFNAFEEGGLLNEELADGLLQGRVDEINQSVSAALSAGPLTAGSSVDFTLAAIDVIFSAADLQRDAKTDRELIDEYLVSNALAFVTPDAVQTDYVGTISTFGLLGGANDFLPGSIYAQDGGFADGIALGDFVGFYVEAEGSLLDSLNLSAVTSGSFIYDILDPLDVGDEFTLDLAFSGSDAAFAEDTTNVRPIPEPATMLLLGTVSLGAVGCARKKRKQAD